MALFIPVFVLFYLYILFIFWLLAQAVETFRKYRAHPHVLWMGKFVDKAEFHAVYLLGKHIINQINRFHLAALLPCPLSQFRPPPPSLSLLARCGAKALAEPWAHLWCLCHATWSTEAW